MQYFLSCIKKKISSGCIVNFLQINIVSNLKIN